MVAASAAFCATGCMTPDVTSNYNPQPGDPGMRAYGSTGCLDVEKNVACAEPVTVVSTTIIDSQPLVTESFNSTAVPLETTVIAADAGWRPVGQSSVAAELPVNSVAAVDLADDEGWRPIGP